MIPRTAFPLVAVLAAAAGCSGGGGGGSSGNGPFALLGATAQGEPQLSDDMITVTFSRSVRKSDAQTVANYTLESPIGTAVDLEGATFVVSNKTVTIILSQSGADAVNLAPGSSFQLAVSNVRDKNGNPLPAGSVAAGAVGGTNAPPVLATVSPANGPAFGGTTLLVTGTGFTDPATLSLTIGGAGATDLARVDGETLSALSPAGAVGLADVAITTPSGMSTLPLAYAYDLTVTGLSPAEGTAAGGTLVTFLGGGFANDSGLAVTFGGVPAASLTFVDSTTLQATTPEAVPGAVDVSVTSAGSTVTLSLAFRFQMVLSGISPGEGPASGGTTVTLTGSGFVPAGTSVRFGSLMAANVVVSDSRTLSCTVPPNGSPATVDVTVSSAGGSATLGGGYRYRTVLDRVEPSFGSVAGGVSVTLTGAGFTSPADTTVLFGSTAAVNVQVLDAVTIVCTSPPSLPGSVSVSVINSVDSAVLPGAFDYLETPSLTGLAPTAGSTSGGTTVDLTGTGFFAGMSVTFGGLPATSIVITDPMGHAARVTTPRAPEGAAEVRVTTPLGSATIPGGFIFFVPFPLFDATLDQLAGRQPFDLAAGDVNGDGAADIVACNFEAGAGALRVFLGHGDGDLTLAHTVPVGGGSTGPSSVALGDLDGDGDLDAVVTNQNGSSFTVFVNDGIGGFTAGENVFTDSGPASAVIAEFTGDSHPDVLVVCRNTGVLNLRQGVGDGTFVSPRTTILVPCCNPSSPEGVAAGDLDGDSIADLAIADRCNSQVAIALGLGSPTAPFFTFPEGGCHSVGSNANAAPTGVEIGDLTGDGVPDIVTTNLLDDSVSVLVGAGGGAFAPSRTFPTGRLPNNRPLGVAIGDFDGDGLSDVVTTQLEGDTVSVLAGDGTGGLGPPLNLFGGERPGSAVAVNLNPAEGMRVDVVVANRDSGTISALLARGPGLSAAPTMSTAGTPESAASDDLNKDGLPDIAVVNNDGSSRVIRNDGSGTFSLARSFQLRPDAALSDVIIGDFDVDGHADVAALSKADGRVYVYLGSGTFGFQGPVSTQLGSLPIGMGSGDFNADGIPDMCLANEGVAGNTVTSIAVGDGTGAFINEAQYGQAVEPQVVRPGELTGDEHLDLAVFGPNADNGSMVIFIGDGSGFFADARANILLGTRFYGGDVADLDGDGDLDGVACGSNAQSPENGRMAVFLNEGAGNFPPPVIHSVGGDPRSVVLSDLNGDGLVDAAVSCAGSCNAAVLFGDGAGGFSSRIQLAGSSTDSVRILASPVYGSGANDLLIVNRGTSTISILRNRS